MATFTDCRDKDEPSSDVSEEPAPDCFMCKAGISGRNSDQMFGVLLRFGGIVGGEMRPAISR